MQQKLGPENFGWVWENLGRKKIQSKKSIEVTLVQKFDEQKFGRKFWSKEVIQINFKNVGPKDRLGFSPRTHKLYFQEILKVTGNLKEYDLNFKSTRLILCMGYI